MKWHVVIIHPDGTSEVTDFDNQKDAEDYFKEKLAPGSQNKGYIYQS